MRDSAIQGPIQSGTGAAAGADQDATVAKAVDAAEKFEGYFIGELLRQMRAGTKELSDGDSIYNSPTDGDMLDMADVALGNSLASQHAFGIADTILKQLLPSGTAPGQALKETAGAVAHKK